MTPIPLETDRVHVTRSPGVCGGKPCIVGTRIRVLDVYVWHELQGKSVDEIVHDFPELSMADVFGALTYLWDHREEIVQSLHDEQVVADRYKAIFPSKLHAG